MYCNIVFMIDIFVISKITQYRYYVIAITDVRSLGLSTKWRTLMIKKTMKVRENTFRKLEDPFENGAAKKYVFYVKVDDVAEGIPMATNPRDTSPYIFSSKAFNSSTSSSCSACAITSATFGFRRIYTFFA